MEDMLDPASGGRTLFQQAFCQRHVNKCGHFQKTGVSLRSGLDRITGDDSQNHYLEYL
jgi:hypothetical protein